MKFSEKLIQLRKATGLSQEELGNRLNVARQTVSKWELGETTPEMEKLIKLSEIFNITLDELIKDENDKKENSEITSNNTNSQKLAGMVIKILKGIGIFIIVSIILYVILIVCGLIAFNRTRTDTGSNVVTQMQEEIVFYE